MATTPDLPSPPSPPSPPKRKILRLVLIALLVISAASGAAYYYLRSQVATATVKPPEDPIFVALDPFTVNLQPNGRNRFLHVAVTLKLANPKSQTQITQYLPEARSRVLNTLSNRTSESLGTTEEKDLLARDILAALNQPFASNLPSAGISSVMFTTFMLQ